MTTAEAKSTLIALAAQMARRTNMPEPETWPWPRRLPRMVFNAAHRDCERASEQCRRWCIELKTIADNLE